MKPICVPCRRFFRLEKMGFYFIEGMPKARGVLPGNAAPDQWQPYKVWAGDLWRCPDCGAEIIVGTGGSAIREHYEPDFADTVHRLGADQLQVNDC